MHYTWTDSKNRRNLKLHGIGFETAVSIFDGPTLEQEDDRFDYGERRVYAIGVVNGLEVTVIFADREPEERRKAVAKADHDLRATIRDIGWINVVRFGVPAACDAAFIVSQSGDLVLMQATVPLIQSDLANSEGGEICALEALKAYEALRSR